MTCKQGNATNQQPLLRNFHVVKQLRKVIIIVHYTTFFFKVAKKACQEKEMWVYKACFAKNVIMINYTIWYSVRIILLIIKAYHPICNLGAVVLSATQSDADSLDFD